MLKDYTVIAKTSVPKLAALIGVSRQRLYDILSEKSKNSKLNKKLLLIALSLDEKTLEKKLKSIEESNNDK
ncbi:hypothetical protein CIG1485E_a0090 (plasmid) [Campylobacter iguaniorum]|uniref:Uncharacterized protein n=1 Tax=Campylobacter iguaniorum TaxID=1244531 RepID=A0A076FBL3_9BACT|nr:hypothetical protein [Campylobacter iguaniorum]AII15615.1 hypothetical protein CIG1485E_a0090 [Campylobacter iguaniorum]